jgi:broad specificity phosphatase PhoE
LIHENFECEFYFIRHGESETNATAGVLYGANFDSALTDKGVEQAGLLGRRLEREGVEFDRVYSSSMVRTVQTTEIMLDAFGQPGRPFERVDALMEQQAPGWRGVPASEVLTPETVAYMNAKGSHFVPPQGESLRTVQRRTSGWIEDEIIYNEELVASEQPLRIAVIGHGTASQCLFHYIMGFDDRLITRFTLDNCSISRFRFNERGWFPISINDSTHLNGYDGGASRPS